MKTSKLAIALAAALGTSLSLAHHGPVTNSALYLTDEIVELDGELIEVFWHNPHTRGRLKVVGDDGTETIWEVELGTGPRSFEARGLSAEDFIGQVKVAGHISRRGTHEFGALHVLLPDGQEIMRRGRQLRWSNVEVAAADNTLDPAKVAADRASARSIFRTWGRTARGSSPEQDLPVDELTARGSELAAAFDPLTDSIELIECQQGMPDMMFDPVPMEIVDQGDRILIHVAEYNSQRTVHLDTATSPEPELSGKGYSTGRWVDDTLIVTTTSVDWPYYSELGLPQTTDAVYVERFSVTDGGDVLNYSITISDPEVVSRPFALERTRPWTPGVEIPPYDCVVEWEE